MPYAPKLRAGNRALDYLVSHNSSRDTQLKSIIDSLPEIADGLYRFAQGEARTLLQTYTSNSFVRVARVIAAAIPGMSAKEKALANCIYDLLLTVYFTELAKLVADYELVSVSIDALVYQATGSEAGSSTEEEVLSTGTQNTRGIHKFQVARKIMPHIGDIDAWVFGKEFSAIMSGSPMNIAYIVPVSPFSVMARFQARWHVRHVLYGTSPTKEDEQALEVAIKQQEKSMKEMIDGFLKTKGA
jgi:hypothetical protein